MVDWLLFWTGVTAVATILGAIAAAAAAIAAIVTLRALREDSLDRTRPVVIADLVRNPVTDHQIDFVIRNVGATPASKLRVTFAPVPLVNIKEKWDPAFTELADHMVKRYLQPIELLGPGAALSNIYWRKVNEGADNALPFPDELEVKVEYSDLRAQHSYNDTFQLTTATHRRETYSRPAGKDYPKRVAAAAEAIARGVGSA